MFYGLKSGKESAEKNKSNAVMLRYMSVGIDEEQYFLVQAGFRQVVCYPCGYLILQ